MKHWWLFSSNKTAQSVLPGLLPDTRVWHCPIIDVVPLPSAPLSFDDVDEVVVISANALSCAQPLWPTAINPMCRPRAWLMGEVLIASMPSFFSAVCSPQSGNDSEALLREPAFSPAAIKSKTVLIIKGEGGRDFLANTLRERGALVRTAVLYRRAINPDCAALIAQQWHVAEQENTRPEGLLVLSSLALEGLTQAIHHPALKKTTGSAILQTPLWVHHWRIAKLAIEWGWCAVRVESGVNALLSRLRLHH